MKKYKQQMLYAPWLVMGSQSRDGRKNPLDPQLQRQIRKQVEELDKKSGEYQKLKREVETKVIEFNTKNEEFQTLQNIQKKVEKMRKETKRIQQKFLRDAQKMAEDKGLQIAEMFKIKQNKIEIESHLRRIEDEKRHLEQKEKIIDLTHKNVITFEMEIEKNKEILATKLQQLENDISRQRASSAAVIGNSEAVLETTRKMHAEEYSYQRRKSQMSKEEELIKNKQTELNTKLQQLQEFEQKLKQEKNDWDAERNKSQGYSSMQLQKLEAESEKQRQELTNLTVKYEVEKSKVITKETQITELKQQLDVMREKLHEIREDKIRLEGQMALANQETANLKKELFEYKTALDNEDDTTLQEINSYLAQVNTMRPITSNDPKIDEESYVDDINGESEKEEESDDLKLLKQQNNNNNKDNNNINNNDKEINKLKENQKENEMSDDYETDDDDDDDDDIDSDDDDSLKDKSNKKKGAPPPLPPSILNLPIFADANPNNKGKHKKNKTSPAVSHFMNQEKKIKNKIKKNKKIHKEKSATNLPPLAPISKLSMDGEDDELPEDFLVKMLNKKSDENNSRKSQSSQPRNSATFQKLMPLNDDQTQS